MGALVGELQALIGGDVTPWVAAGADADSGPSPFDVASRLVASVKKRVRPASVDALAAAAVHGVIDGGYTDNSGVANAVAAGATEVVVLLNSNASTSLSHLFSGREVPPAGNAMSGNGEPYQPPSLYPVFSAPSATDASVRFRSFARLHLPAASTTYLQEVAVGSLRAVTAANGAWGLSAGRAVTLHVISVSSSLNIGEFENFLHYDALVEEIATAIVAAENEQLVTDILLPMMLGPTRTR